jgi:hypothetical protein
MPKRLDLYYQANITRRDLVILQEEKWRSDSRNIIATIVLLPLPPLLQPLSPLLTPEPLELEIPAKYLDYEPKVLDPPDITELKPNTLRK